MSVTPDYSLMPLLATKPTIPLVLLLTSLACGPNMADVGGTDPLVGNAGVRVINAANSPVDVLIDGQTMVRGLMIAHVSDRLNVTTGSHVVRLVGSAGSSAQVQIDATTSATRTAVVAPSGSSLAATVLADTGALVPVGKSKLRVAHLSPNAGSIEIWRTQPDFQTPVHIMTPFDYLATSPYLQSDPGAWEVFVTRPGTTTKLATTGLVQIPSGEKRTAVLLDSAGVVLFRVIVD
jgi:hypothetical protein